MKAPSLPPFAHSMARHDIATRAQALTLRVSGTSHEEILRQTGMDAEIVDRLLGNAMTRGFDPQSQRPIIRDHFIQAPRSRPSQHRVESALQPWQIPC